MVGFKKLRLILVSGIAGFATALLLCFALLWHHTGGAANIPSVLRFSEAMKVIDDNYIGEYDLQKLTDGSINAAIASLGDRWGWYLNAQGYEAYKLHESNQYSGIGITIEKMPEEEGGGVKIVNVRKNTPASEAGIEPGMILHAIDGEDVRALEIADIRAIISDKADEEFSVKLYLADGSEFEAKVKAQVIFTAPVEWEMLDGGTGYISIENFESGAGDGVRQALAELTEAGIQNLVFDVRGNPGGKVSELRDCLDAILPECVIFVAVGSNGKISENTSDSQCINLPMAVLVNGSSYSAAEYFAAVLEEYEAAILVGSPTTGKSRSQQTFVLSDGSAVHISTAGYLTPGRVDLTEAEGLRPEIDVPLTEEEQTLLQSGLLAFEDDPQLRAAVSEIS